MVLLRKLEPTDLPYLYQWENDSLVWARGGTHNPLSQQDLREYISSTTGDIYRDGQLRLIIENNGQTSGCVDLFDFDIRNRKAAIGMYISSEARGKGIGKEVLRLIEEYAFGFLHLRMIYAVITTDNQACSTLFSHAGYIPSSALPAWTIESAAVIWIKQSAAE